MKWNLDNFVIIKIEEVTIVLHRWNVYFVRLISSSGIYVV